MTGYPTVMDARFFACKENSTDPAESVSRFFGWLNHLPYGASFSNSLLEIMCFFKNMFQHKLESPIRYGLSVRPYASIEKGGQE